MYFLVGEISLYVYKFLLPTRSFVLISSKQSVSFNFLLLCWLSLPLYDSVKAFCQKNPLYKILLCSLFFFFSFLCYTSLYLASLETSLVVLLPLGF